MTDHEKRIREAICPGDFTMVEVPDLIATLADLDAARAALSEAKAGGWVAVPVEPTQEMVDAMAKAAHDTDEPANKFYRVLYAAMLAASPLPAPPAQKEPT